MSITKDQAHRVLEKLESFALIDKAIRNMEDTRGEILKLLGNDIMGMINSNNGKGGKR